MKQRLLKFSLILLIPVTILAVLMAVATNAETTNSAALDSSQPALNSNTDPSIIASRLISIPYGIDSPLPLSTDGQTVQVTGHGECPDGGESFMIQVTLTQNGPQNRAMGVTQDNCEGQSSWSAVANTPGNKTLTPGPAQACGRAFIFSPAGDTLVGEWCVDVILQ